MELKRKQKVLRNKFLFRVFVCIFALVGSALYLLPKKDSDLWTIIIGACGSALVWALVELFDFFVQRYLAGRNYWFNRVNVRNKTTQCGYVPDF